LINRSRKPLSFTPIAEQHEASIRQLVTQIYEFRATLNSDSNLNPNMVLAAQHSLATSQLPKFIEELRIVCPDQKFRIRSENRDDGVSLLLKGQADILLTYETTHDARCIPAQLASACVLGDDALVLAASPKLCNAEEFQSSNNPLPLLCFPPESFFGKVVRTQALAQLMKSRLVSIQYVSDFSLGLREMALIHQGAAWLPRSLIAHDLASGNLQEVNIEGSLVPLTIVAYFANQSNAVLEKLTAHFFRQRNANGIASDRSLLG
jgi:DNA-binding transcriptional LysR family regulator